MINMYKYFPTIIGEVINKDHFQYENKLVNKCLHLQEKIKSGGEDWISKETYNTLGKYNLFYDNDFLEINNFINQQVIQYCKNLKIDSNCLEKEPSDSWFNIYKKNNFQEYHFHSNTLISTVYFLKCNNNSARIFFKSPIIDQINPTIESYTDDTYERIFFNPVPGKLLIFRGYLEHAVEQQQDNDMRITLAYNYRKANL